jgi:hypothetical protein
MQSIVAAKLLGIVEMLVHGRHIDEAHLCRWKCFERGNYMSWRAWLAGCRIRGDDTDLVCAGVPFTHGG